MMFEENASIVNEIATSIFLKLCMIQAIIFSTSLNFEGEAGIQVLDLEEVFFLNDFCLVFQPI